MAFTFDSITQMKKQLTQLDGWLEKAVAFSKTKSFDANVLVSARLAPDQYALARQVQSACDSAKFAAARLSGKEAPKHPDTEATVEELRTRVKAVVAYLETFKDEDFKASETRIIPLPFMEGQGMLGKDYLVEMSQPNFFFHLTHVYAILRHNGVDLGKRDFLAPPTTRAL